MSNQMSRHYMLQELKKHLSHESVEKIKLCECLKAGTIARSTFYNHFPGGLYDAFNQLLELELFGLVDDLLKTGDWECAMSTAINYLKENRQMCLAIYQSVDVNASHRYLQTYLQRSIAVYFAQRTLNIPAVFLKLHERFLLDAMSGSLIHWLDDDLQASNNLIFQRLWIGIRGNLHSLASLEPHHLDNLTQMSQDGND